jgi:hypothetical protein
MTALQEFGGLVIKVGGTLASQEKNEFVLVELLGRVCFVLQDKCSQLFHVSLKVKVRVALNERTERKRTVVHDGAAVSDDRGELVIQSFTTKSIARTRQALRRTNDLCGHGVGIADAGHVRSECGLVDLVRVVVRRLFASGYAFG